MSYGKLVISWIGVYDHMFLLLIIHIIYSNIYFRILVTLLELL